MRRILFTLLLTVSARLLPAQNIHLFLAGGLMNYQGDLQAKRITFNQSHPYLGGGLYYELSEKLYIRAGAVMGKVSAHDKYSPVNYTRNLSFESRIYEGHLGLEYDILNAYEHRITPYLFAGLAGYHFSPYGVDSTKKKTYLQPLGTEGQGFYQGRKKYSLNQLAIPFGGGVKLVVNDNVYIRVEAVLRKLQTDYLDDVSTTYVPEPALLANNGPVAVAFAYRADELPQYYNTHATEGAIRGNPSSKDFYYTVGISLSYRLGSGDGYERGGKPGKSKLGCPVNVY